MNTKRILALFLAVVTCLSLAVSASAASISDFKDVDTKAWYAEAVTAAVDNGLLYGKSRTQLDPNGLLTRAEMAAITNRSFGCYKAADISAYKDVLKNKWHYNDVALAVQMGTYNGVSASSMQPDRAITRQEAIAVVARALQLDLDDYAKTDLSKFADAKDVSTWALPYMKAMVAAGYVHGRTKGLAPQANITRAEFAQLYFNIIQSYITKNGSYTKDYKGNLLVRTKDVELKDMTIDGDLIIGCGAPLMPAFGLVDYCRIGCDVGLDWDGSFIMKMAHRERISTKHSLENTLFRRGLNGRAFGNDPDVFFLRSDNLKLSGGQKTMLARADALLGSVFFTSDDMNAYDEEKRETYRELRRLLDAENVRVRMDGMPRIEYTLDGEEQRLALPFLTADM